MPKAIEDSLDNVPSELHEYYTERNGKFELTGFDGLRTQADVDRLQSALAKERDDHKRVKERFKVFEGLDADEVRSKLDRVEELELLVAGKPDDAAIEKLVQGRLKTALNPVEREKQKALEELNAARERLNLFEMKEKHRTVADSVLSVVNGSSAKVKLNQSAIEDALMYAERMLEIDETGNVVTKDGIGITPGLSPEVWLQEMIAKKPHWSPESVGGGASGSGSGRGLGGPNPFSKDGWNMTEQGRLLRTDPRKAEQLAKLAGTTIGGPRPIK